MTRTEKMIARAEANGRAVAKTHLGQIASKGVPFPLSHNYVQKFMIDAWQRGVNEIMA